MGLTESKRREEVREYIMSKSEYYVGFWPGAGDIICLFSACQRFIEKYGCTVYADFARDVVEAYGNPNFRFGRSGNMLQVDARYHRLKSHGGCYNYLGTFLAPMGLLIEPYPSLNLPTFDISSGVERKALIQPFSHWAENPPLEYVQGLVDAFIESTGMKLYAIGSLKTPRTLKNVDYSLLQDGITNMMRCIQNAAFVLTPRSASAHIAAGYRIPCFVWCPSDGENWHLDYKNWPNKRIEFKYGLDTLKYELVEFLKDNIVTKSLLVELPVIVKNDVFLENGLAGPWML